VSDAERAGFVERAPDPDDRRRTIVSLVPDRRAAVSTWIDGASAPMERALDRLSPDERASFGKGMTFLEAELNADADDVQRKELQRTASQPKRL
jgi:DNA-binding MarR family transcriptional regulator